MERPTGVTILAVLAFIVAAFCLLAALMFLVGGTAISAMMKGSAGGGMGAIFAGLGAIAGVIILLFAALYAVVGFGLWKLQNWGRIICVVLVALGLLSSAWGAAMSVSHPGVMIWELCWVALDVWIIVYLFKPHVKQAFGAS